MYRKFLCLGFQLLIVGCFQDSGPEGDGVETESVTDGGGTSSDIEGSSSTSDDDVTKTPSDTSSSVTDDGSDSSAEDTSSGESGTDAGSSDVGSSSEDACDEEPVEIPIDQDLFAGDTESIHIDFDILPGIPGDRAELCASFYTNDFASMRTITIGDESLEFGPCVIGEPGHHLQCKPYTKPSGLTEVVIDNSTATPGCNSGAMSDILLSFYCDEDETPVDCSDDWLDPYSGLCWQNPPPDILFGDADAEAYCSALGAGWRVPSIDELRTLIRLPAEPDGDCELNLPAGGCEASDPSCLEPACVDSCGSCQPAGGDAAGGCYWPDAMEGSCEGGRYMTSSKYGASDTAMWSISFWTAAVYYSTEGHLRCVGDTR